MVGCFVIVVGRRIWDVVLFLEKIFMIVIVFIIMLLIGVIVGWLVGLIVKGYG